MSKHYQESEIEFRLDGDGDVRGLVVYVYGGDAEEIIAAARKIFNLGHNWKVVRLEMVA